MNMKTYRTSDIIEIVYYLVRGVAIHNTSKDHTGRVTFEFKDGDKCLELKNEIQRGDDMVSLGFAMSTTRRVRDMIHRTA